MTIVMREHPAWSISDGVCLRAFGSPDEWGVVAATADSWRTFGSVRPCPDAVEPVAFPPEIPTSLAETLISMGTVVRWRTPDLWEAIATAIIRQVIRAGQARKLHEHFRATYGTPVCTALGTAYLMPDAATVAGLPAEAFAALGMAFKRRPLQAAAAAYLEHGEKWRELPSMRLVEELQTVPRIGPWTAGAAVADHTHDWTLYPHGDLAVRTWATAAAPDTAWPASEEAFASLWRRIAGDHLGALTLFTLAWGAHHGTSL